MFRPRVIPCLLLKEKGLVKTIKFKDPTYVGDPINAIKIFNEKYVDELIFLDISATVRGCPPQIDIIEKITKECFMPVCYGGGIKDIETIKKILHIGIEKVSISSHAVSNPDFISSVSCEFGSQSIVVTIDVKKSRLNKYEIVTHNATRCTGLDPVRFAMEMEEKGAGELLINSVDRDGLMNGYDIDLITKITDKVSIPVIACGGAGKLEDMREVITRARASSAAAGSLFVFYGKLRAVLINYPEQKELEALFN